MLPIKYVDKFFDKISVILLHGKMIFSMQQESHSRKFIYFCLDVIVRRQSPVFILFQKCTLFNLKHIEVKNKSDWMCVGAKVNLSNSRYSHCCLHLAL